MSRARMSRAWRERPISTFLATGAGIGMIPFAPGTWGSLEGLAIAAYFNAAFGFDLAPPGMKPEYWRVMLLTLVTGSAVALLGVFASGRVERACGIKDPSAVVIDEVAGQLLASAPAVLLDGSRRTVGLVISFALFRLFDIWKPGPIRRLQDLPGGWGIMLDDVAAGLLAGAITFGIGRLS